MTDKEKEQWFYEMYTFTSNFDFRRLYKYEEANDDIHIDDLILDYTMLYEDYKDKTEELECEIDDLQCKIDELESNEIIKDIDEFKWQLKLDGLWNEKLDDFIDHYLKYHNN